MKIKDSVSEKVELWSYHLFLLQKDETSSSNDAMDKHDIVVQGKCSATFELVFSNKMSYKLENLWMHIEYWGFTNSKFHLNHFLQVNIQIDYLQGKFCQNVVLFHLTLS